VGDAQDTVIERQQEEVGNERASPLASQALVEMLIEYPATEAS
jgi:hypothetical protein